MSDWKEEARKHIDEWEFDFYSTVLHYGNRQDGQIIGCDDWEDDWYSWEAEHEPNSTSTGWETQVRVTQANHDDLVYKVTWERVE